MRAALVLAAGLALAAPPVPAQIDGPRSGADFLTPDTRALQDDDFLNPGLFAVEEGRALWNRVEGTAGQACASCHAEADMRGVAARYPVFDPVTGGLVDLPGRVNAMRADHMGAPDLPRESQAMLALTAFLGFQSRGVPMAVETDGPARPFFEAGREDWFRRRGQLNLSCAQCHDDLAGRRLRGDTISQGQVNGMPFYRLMWRTMASRHRMFEWCETSLRAEPRAAGSAEYLALELYVAWRGRGLPVETPAVRR